jgi:MEMO1 family protein
MIRQPAVAGSFYPSDSRELAQQIDSFTAGGGKKIQAYGCIVPHAGYMYSGHVAGAVYAALQIPTECILLGPRHFPRGEPLAILTEGSWSTPLGEAEIETALAAALASACPQLRDNAMAHEREHSLEVQIPFLQRLVGEALRFVPVVLATDRFPVMEAVGRAVAQTVSAQSEPVLVIASTDMNHYESDSITRDKDRRAIERILALDPRGLYDTVRFGEISMCGYAATVAMLVAMRDLGATEAQLIRYATSGDINGDRDQVVGYAGMTVL